MKYEGCVVLVRRGHLVLAVEKGILDWNLPGGKREPHETSPVITAHREVKEETGLDLELKHLVEYETLILANGHPVVLFNYTLPPLHFLTSSDEGRAAWVDADMVLEETCSHRISAEILLGSPHEG